MHLYSIFLRINQIIFYVINNILLISLIISYITKLIWELYNVNSFVCFKNANEKFELKIRKFYAEDNSSSNVN